MTKNQFSKALAKLKKHEVELSILQSKLKSEYKALYDECVNLMLKADITYHWNPDCWVNLHEVRCSAANGENVIIRSLSYTRSNAPITIKVLEKDKCTSAHIEFLLELKEQLIHD